MHNKKDIRNLKIKNIVDDYQLPLYQIAYEKLWNGGFEYARYLNSKDLASAEQESIIRDNFNYDEIGYPGYDVYGIYDLAYEHGRQSVIKELKEQFKLK
jgi:hypothetical protein